MLLMYSVTTTARLQYIVNFFSHELFDDAICITNNAGEYINHTGPKFNYSSSALIQDDFIIRPVELLFEQDIREQNISCFEFNFQKAFFETGGDLQFDILAASFYLISRYEEYLPHEKDEYGRYSYTNSLAFREGFLNKPLVNIWINDFKNALKAKFPRIIFRGQQFSNLITYDIDIAYSYLDKGFIRNIGGTLKSIWQGNWRSAIERWQVLAGKKKDPFDCYEWLDALHLYCRLKPYYFFLVAGKISKYDRNIPATSKRFRQLMEYYSAAYNVGIHPSWQSGDDHSLLNEELEWLETVTGKRIPASRQHFIRFTMPATYRRLLSAGLSCDFSMGYGSINGFRASVCSSFKWFDLERDQSTSLRIFPFCYMDANSFYEEKHSPQEAYDELMSYYNAVKKVNGMLITIWHNHVLGCARGTEGWGEMFELFMRETVYWDAYYDGSVNLHEEFLFSRVFS